MTNMAATARSSTPAPTHAPDHESADDSTTAPAPAPAEPRLGLRERKKQKTRMAIRRATYRLVEQQGYERTTVEQIAEAAEVSPSTVFRYFPTKEDIVITDEYDPIMEQLLRDRPKDEPLLESLRHVVHNTMNQYKYETPAELRLRARLMNEVPSIRSRMMEGLYLTGDMLRRVVAERSGLHPDDLEVRVYCMSILAGLMEVSRHWSEHGQQGDMSTLVDRALHVLEHGLSVREENTPRTDQLNGPDGPATPANPAEPDVKKHQG
ncbi:transcriptional regulator, TetR family [Actinobacteria bacterium OK074]|nr:transcriptional regulator, TetR family [Actinobacteria bacterium OK074]